jgi:hypothetical protein
MANETVIIGCKLPSGIILEVGYSVDEKTSIVKQGPNYKKIALRGWHAHTAEARKTGLQLPAGMSMRPFLNRGIDKAAWDEWKRTHAGSWLLKNEILFEAKDEASAALRVAEGDDTPAPFAPIDPKKTPPGITKADFATEKA